MTPSDAQVLCSRLLEAIDNARGSGIPDPLLDADAARVAAISGEIDAAMFSLAAGMFRRLLADPEEVPPGFPETDLGIRFFRFLARDLRGTATGYGLL